MLKNLMKWVVLISAGLLTPQLSFAVEHPPGHVAGSGAGAAGCQKVGIRNMKPAALTEVAAGSQFSVIVFGTKNPDDIEVTAKKIPVPVKVDVRDDFFLVTGTLPAEIKDSAARINVKIKGKIANCTEESGWLVKVTH